MVNWTDSPGYKLAKHLNTTLSDILLPNAFNIQKHQHISAHIEICSLQKTHNHRPDHTQGFMPPA